MANIQVRHVPTEVHQALVRRAELAGQSLQQFLAGQLAVIAATPSVDEVLDRIERRSKGCLCADEAVAVVSDERARLLTADRRLASAPGVRCAVELI